MVAGAETLTAAPRGTGPQYTELLEPSVVQLTWNLSTQESEARLPRVQGHPQLHAWNYAAHMAFGPKILLT